MYDPEVDLIESDPSERLTDTRPAVPLVLSLILIFLSLAVAFFLIWIVRVGWVLELLAGAILISDAVIAVIVGRYVYRNMDKVLWPTRAIAKWVKLTVAIILGFAVAMTAMELQHSHKLIRDYDHYSSDYDDN